MSTPTAGGQPDLHPSLANRPHDPHRGLPVPVMNMPPGSTDPSEADFTGIHAQTVYETAAQNRCGICGDSLGYWMAFIGGPKSFEARTYIDPPFCIPCAETAMRLCPHMAIRRHRRAPEHRLADDSHTPDGFDEDKPDEFIMGITRSFRIEMNRNGTFHFRAAPFKKRRVFRYVDNILTEVSA